ncbi:MAG: hypothetical protein PHU53_08045 [Thermoplasmata archaeon]|nr:hypothetical protein [Thermoplasmata archaeon]
MEIKFGTAGVRGITDLEITEETCWKLGTALVKKIGGTPEIALGRDTRPGADRLAGVCAAAMDAAGASVRNYGICPSPALSAMILGKNMAGGLMVTGSHMPYDRIGLIPLAANGAIPPRESSSELADLANTLPPPNTAKGSLPEPSEFALDYLEFLLEACGSRLPGKGISVALDPAGATGAGLVSRLMNDIGCNVQSIHDSREDFAPRRMEPRADSVEELIELVRESGADFGAAYDADCDRVLFVDETGKPLSEDLSAVIFAKYLFNGGPGTVVTPVNSSGLMKAVWKGRVEECIIGPPEISIAAETHGAVFAYEESGKYFFPPGVMWADGILATVMMARILATSKKKLSAITAEFPRHVQIKRNVKVPDAQMASVLSGIRNSFSPAGAVLNDIDGLKYTWPDGSWLLIRLSGTEPLVRVYVDSPSPDRARELSDMGTAAVKHLIF